MCTFPRETIGCEIELHQTQLAGQILDDRKCLTLTYPKISHVT